MQSLLFPVLLLLSVSATAQIPADVELQAVPGISGLDSPLGLKHAGDGSGRIFIVEQGGTVRVIDATGSLLTTPFIDVSSLLTSGGERGLLDIAFHPEYAVDGAGGEGLFYLHFSSDGESIDGTETGDTVVAEFSVTGDPDVADDTPIRTILTVTQDFSNHNGGQMRFGTDGYLYLGLGDGGSGNDPCDRSQTLDPADIQTGSGCKDQTSVALLGKMLRIDIDSTTPPGTNNLCAADGDGSAEYSIPADNPFAGINNRCGEVLHYGLRNPWRWSFDRATGDMWIGDVGQNTWEEIDLLQSPTSAAENFGWKPCEGSFVRGSTTTACQLAGSILPVLEYQTGQNGNRSVTGGYRYRGPVTSLRGFYIYGDFSSGNIWFASNDSGTWQSDLFQSIGNIRSFGEDEQGNLYVYSGSTLLRFEGNIELVFADGFES